MQVSFPTSSASYQAPSSQSPTETDSPLAVQIVNNIFAKCNPNRPLRVNSSAGQLTSSMRFIGMLNHLSRKSNCHEICIVGPGQSINSKKQVFSPQFLELVGLFPDANFLILDRDRPALKALQKQFGSGLPYDPLMFITHDSQSVGSKPDQTMLKTMKQGLLKKATDPEKVRRILERTDQTDVFMLKIPKNQVKLRVFDIKEHPYKPEENGKFDVIVATLSITHAILEDIGTSGPNKNHLLTLFKFIQALNIEGSLYIDSFLFELLETFYGKKFIEMTLDYFSFQLGNQIVIERLEFPTGGKHANIRNETIEGYSYSTTFPIIVFKNTGKKPKQLDGIKEKWHEELNQLDLPALEKRLNKFLNDFNDFTLKSLPSISMAESFESRKES